MSDITEYLIHQMLFHHNHHQLTSRNARVEKPTPTPPKLAPKNELPGRLDGKLKKH
jgi:hypothetical protein